MAHAFEEQRRSPDLDALSFEERLGLLVDREAAERDTKRLVARLKFASLRQDACIEDVDLRTPRGLDRAVFARLVAGRWIDRYENLLISGATGAGKSWIACALGHKACRDNRSVLYHRVPRLFEAARARPRRRPLRSAPEDARTRPVAHSRRLGLVRPQPLRAPRSARDHRRSPWARIHDRHQPGPRRGLARHHRRPDARRRYPRPPRAQRPPTSAHGRKHEKTSCPNPRP